MSRIIVHLDADAFFASVEQAADPRLRGKAVAVGGEKRGIIASASYEARRFGVATPMPTVRARQLCPNLIVVPGDFEKYERFSRWMFSYAYDFTPDVEIGSIDEGYFDLSSRHTGALAIAETIGKAIRQSLKITVSEGIGSNKLVSQIASKFKKPAALLNIPAGYEVAFLHPLPNRWLPGIGPKTGQRLDSAGLTRISQIAGTPTDLLHLLVGNSARTLKEFAQGIDDRPVIPASQPAKSYGEQETFGTDQVHEEFIQAVLQRMADRLMAKVRADGKCIRTLTVKVRYNDMAEDQAAESLPEPTDLETDLYGPARQLLRRAWKRRVSLRLVSLRLANVYAAGFPAELPFDRQAQQRAARHRLSVALDGLRRDHGPRAIFRGHDFTLESQKTSPPPAVKPDYHAPATHQPGALREEPAAYGQAMAARQRLANKFAFAVNRQDIDHAKRPLPSRSHRVFSTRPLAMPLEVHSYYSFLDSTLSIEAIVERAAHLQLPAIALTDTGNLHGAVSFYQAARAAGIKPIIGSTFSVQGQTVRLYVQNQTGFENLCRILSSPRPEQNPQRQERRRPRKNLAIGNAKPVNPEQDETPVRLSAVRDRACLLEWNEGLIAVGSDPRLGALFKDRFYLAASSIVGLRRYGETRYPIVALRPVHYGSPADEWKFRVVQSIRTLTLLDQSHPRKHPAGEYHFAGDLDHLFPAEPESSARTWEVAERCNFEWKLGPPQFPAFLPPDGTSPREFLRRLVRAGARKRYPNREETMNPQLELELAIISEVGYEEYFLVMWELLQQCRARGIEWITRGSAADSLVCYCLEISDVCPIRFDLYFRRFLNKERMAMQKLPDIDVDFAHDRKDDVVDLIFAKYGREFTAAVGGFSTYHGRGALGDVAKVLGVSEYQIRRLTRRIPSVSAQDLGLAVAASRECGDLPIMEEPYRSALQMAQFLDGFPRYPKMHPCGIVLSRQPILNLTPTFCSHKGYPTTHFDMDAIELVGLVKMDILAQGGLAVMRDVKQGLALRGNPGRAALIQSMEEGRCHHLSTDVAPTSKEIDFHRLAPWEDPQVWEMIAHGGARAVHHIESPAMLNLCRTCNVRDIDTLIAIVSVIRPGAANENKKSEFTRRYQGLSPTVYPHPSLEACLRSTFGLVVYEEHILQMCAEFAGLAPGRADVLRRALAKDNLRLVETIADEFRDAASRLGRAPDEITKVWELVSGFRGYAFCKAHSTAYGVEAYEAAWLKRYFPAQFMAAVLSHGKGFYQPLVYVLESLRLGIQFLPPTINEPGPNFVPHRNADGKLTIRIPATRVKGLTTTTKERLVAACHAAPFASLEDFHRRVGASPDEMELLLRTGAFDCFGRARTAQFWECQLLRQVMGSNQEREQGWLFPAPRMDRLPEVGLEEPSRRQCLEWESELLGFPASGHPLELYEDVAWESYCPVARMGAHIGEAIVTCGLVIEQRVHHQVTGEPMKFLTLADWTGIVETELFAPTYRSYGLATVRYPVLEIGATVEPFENGRGFSLRVHRASKPRQKSRSGRG